MAMRRSGIVILLLVLVGSASTNAAASTCVPAADPRAFQSIPKDPKVQNEVDAWLGQCAANGATNSVGCKNGVITIIGRDGYYWSCTAGAWISAARAPTVGGYSPVGQIPLPAQAYSRGPSFAATGTPSTRTSIPTSVHIAIAGSSARTIRSHNLAFLYFALVGVTLLVMLLVARARWT